MDLKSALFSIFIQYVIPILGTGLFLMAKWALAKWAKSLEAEANATKATMAWQKANAVMQAVVLEIEKTMKPSLQEATKDGVLTKEDYLKLKESALVAFNSYIGTQGKKDLADAMGIISEDLEKFVVSLLESNVAKISSVVGTSGVKLIEGGAKATEAPKAETVSRP